MFKFQNLDQLEKKLLKSENSTNFNIIEAGPKFLTLNTKIAFNRLQLAFIEAPILQYFHPKCYIQIEIDTFSYVINEMLSQLIFGTNLDEVVIKTDLN